MYKFTLPRKEKAKKILDNALEFSLANNWSRLPSDFESSLRECWQVGYQELKGIIIDMLKDDTYRPIAVLYMEQSNCGCVASEFKGHLAKIYGIITFSSQTKVLDRKKYWSTFKGKEL